jgi:hypothetical protein
MRWARVPDRYGDPVAVGGLLIETGVWWLLWSVAAVTAMAVIALAIALSSTIGHGAADWLVSIVLVWAIAVLVGLAVGSVRQWHRRRYGVGLSTDTSPSFRAICRYFAPSRTPGASVATAILIDARSALPWRARLDTAPGLLV